MDTWWQTETGGFMITPLPITPLKPGSATSPFLGIEVDVVDEEGQPVPAGEEGYLVIKAPWPGMLRTLLQGPASATSSSTGREFPGQVPDRRLGAQGRRRLHLDHRPHRRRASRSAATAWARPRWRAPWSATRRSSEAAAIGLPARAEGQRHPRLRHPAHRLRGQPTSWRRSCGTTWATRSARSPGPRRSRSSTAAQDALAARSCAGAQGPRPRPARGRHLHPGGVSYKPLSAVAQASPCHLGCPAPCHPERSEGSSRWKVGDAWLRSA